MNPGATARLRASMTCRAERPDKSPSAAMCSPLMPTSIRRTPCGVPAPSYTVPPVMTMSNSGPLAQPQQPAMSIATSNFIVAFTSDLIGSATRAVYSLRAQRAACPDAWPIPQPRRHQGDGRALSRPLPQRQLASAGTRKRAGTGADERVGRCFPVLSGQRLLHLCRDASRGERFAGPLSAPPLEADLSPVSRERGCQRRRGGHGAAFQSWERRRSLAHRSRLAVDPDVDSGVHPVRWPDQSGVLESLLRGTVLSGHGPRVVDEGPTSSRGASHGGHRDYGGVRDLRLVGQGSLSRLLAGLCVRHRRVSLAARAEGSLLGRRHSRDGRRQRASIPGAVDIDQPRMRRIDAGAGPSR